MIRKIGRALGGLLAVVIVAGAGLWAFGPYESVALTARFEPRKFGEGVQVYFESVEAQYDDITPGTEKRVIWQPGFKEQRTPVSVLYVHGFSATSQEIRPVPDQIANALGANLVYTRLAGHGRPGAALADVTATVWMQDMAEGLAAARAVGDRVVILATSTGATLAAAAALDPEMSQNVAAMIFVSPNFGINNPAAFLLTWPAARHWLPWVMGGERSFAARNPGQTKYWTTAYPWAALPPMAALVKTVAELDYANATGPVLFWLSDGDTVVRPDLTRQVAGRWGGASTLTVVSMGQGDDPDNHVVAGDIMSPGQTGPAVQGMLDWLREQGIE